MQRPVAWLDLATGADPFRSICGSATLATPAKFSGAATASNGLVVFAPHDAHGVGVYDAVADEFYYYHTRQHGAAKFRHAS